MQNPFVTEIARRLSELTGLGRTEVEETLAVPPGTAARRGGARPGSAVVEMGDYAFPCFALARAMKKKPAEVAQEFAAKLQPGELIAGAAANGPYVNFSVRPEAFIAWALTEAHRRKEKFGHSDLGQGQTVVVEFSSPNIAKHLGVHHLRSTMIGNSLVKINRALGYKTVAINFYGDWGTQFGVLIAAYKKWGGPATFEGDVVGNLNALYVRFNQEAEKNPALREEARAWFKKLEAVDAEATALWTSLCKISKEEFNEVYELLEVHFDELDGESHYQDRVIAANIERLTKGIAKEDQGALIVDLSDKKMPPLLLRKSDGATLYDTRDIAAAEDRWNRHHFARMIYVVGADQKLHFRQVFEVLKRMGYSWADLCVHVDFGMVRMRAPTTRGLTTRAPTTAAPTTKMSSRRGEMVMLRDVLREAIERARQAIEAKNPGLPDKESVASAVGIGAVVFNDLKRQRIKDVDFDWDAILSFEGETGPYVQYAHVRLCGILRKYGKPASDAVNFSLLGEPEEFALAKAIAAFGPTLRRAAEACEPALISQYLLDLCSRFSSYYHMHKVLGEDAALTAARILLVDAIRQTIANGLALLGIPAPEEM